MKGRRSFICIAMLFLCVAVRQGGGGSASYAQSRTQPSRSGLSSKEGAAGDGRVSLAYHGGRSYILVERTDLLRYDNGQFTGLLSLEVQSYVADRGADADGNRLYEGSFYVVEETKRDRRRVREGIHDSIDSSFRISPEGELVMLEDNGYPAFRSFPAYSKEKVRPGDKWVAQAERAVDPLNNGTVTRMPILVEYTYVRDDVYNGEDVYVLEARWATRYGTSYIDPEGDGSLQKADGSHKATIIISKKLGNALVIRDTVDETFVYEGGQTVRLKGTISLFTRYPPAYNSREVIALAGGGNGPEAAAGSGGRGNGSAGGSSGGKSSGPGSQGRTGTAGDAPATMGGTTVQETPDGVKIVIRKLQFKSDSAELLPGQEELLDQIARILKAAPDSQYLVEGHTADTRKPAGEKRLSLSRARAVAEALASRGVRAEQFICKGHGASRPVADNDTEEGRAANRRVEITILK
ncbi:MAG: OmpA family protein [Treponema sp.]|nr:OmpA family protein [Treponema sp.]